MSIYGNNSLLSSTYSQFSYNPNNLTLVFDTSKEPENNTVSVLLNGSINCTVFWGDGLSDTYIASTGWKTHTYANPGIYVVQIAGTMTNFSFTSSAATLNNKRKLVRCLSFGNSVQVITTTFANCPNLIQCPEKIPSTATSLQDAFNGCVLFNDIRVSYWNTSNVTSMQGTFRNCQSFNINLNSWNTSSVTNMDSMFGSCSNFNQPLNNWNTGNVLYMGSMFAGAVKFNQPLNNWNVSKVVSMNNMFQLNNVFSQDLSSWDIRRVTNMSLFFSNGSTWGNNNYSNALIAWAALPDVPLTSDNITSIVQGSTTSFIRINTGFSADRYLLGQRVRVSGTINYDGDYTVVSRPSNTALIVQKTYVGDEGAGGTVELLRSRNVTLLVGNTNKYNSNALSARNTLTGTYLWSITDGGASGV